MFLVIIRLIISDKNTEHRHVQSVGRAHAVRDLDKKDGCINVAKNAEFLRLAGLRPRAVLNWLEEPIRGRLQSLRLMPVDTVPPSHFFMSPKLKTETGC